MIAGSKSPRHGRGSCATERVSFLARSMAAVGRTEPRRVDAVPRSTGRRLPPYQGKAPRPQEAHLGQLSTAASAAAAS